VHFSEHENRLAELLRWRSAIAESGAPSPPRATDLVDRLQPWWERWPGRFRTLGERLSRMQLACGSEGDDPGIRPAGNPVPALISHVDAVETCARVVHLSMRNDRLRLGFLLDGPLAREDAFEVTFVSLHGSQPLLLAVATRRADGEYRLATELTPRMIASWRNLRLRDRMPFRLILRPAISYTNRAIARGNPQ
jgi:hypothetical protein